MQDLRIPASTVTRWIAGSRKRTAVVRIQQSSNVDSYWDGGSCSSYTLFSIATGQRLPIAEGQAPFNPNRNGSTHIIQPGTVLVRTGTFCGKPATPTLMVCNEEDLHKVVPQPALAA